MSIFDSIIDKPKSLFDGIVEARKPASLFDGIVESNTVAKSAFDDIVAESKGSTAAADWDDRVARTLTLSEELVEMYQRRIACGLMGEREALEALGFDSRFMEPCMDKTGKLARLFNTFDVYSYSSMPAGVVIATTTGSTPDGSRLGVYETRIDRDADNLIVVEQVAITDFRCFAIGTSV